MNIKCIKNNLVYKISVVRMDQVVLSEPVSRGCSQTYILIISRRVKTEFLFQFTLCLQVYQLYQAVVQRIMTILQIAIQFYRFAKLEFLFLVTLRLHQLYQAVIQRILTILQIAIQFYRQPYNFIDGHTILWLSYNRACTVL